MRCTWSTRSRAVGCWVTFLRENLSRHHGASQHTCDSYAYSSQLLFEFAPVRLRTKSSSLSVKQLDSELISTLLLYLEDTRRLRL